MLAKNKHLCIEKIWQKYKRYLLSTSTASDRQNPWFLVIRQHAWFFSLHDDKKRVHSCQSPTKMISYDNVALLVAWMSRKMMFVCVDDGWNGGGEGKRGSNFSLILKETHTQCATSDENEEIKDLFLFLTHTRRWMMKADSFQRTGSLRKSVSVNSFVFLPSRMRGLFGYLRPTSAIFDQLRLFVRRIRLFSTLHSIYNRNRSL